MLCLYTLWCTVNKYQMAIWHGHYLVLWCHHGVMRPCWPYSHCRWAELEVDWHIVVEYPQHSFETKSFELDTNAPLCSLKPTVHFLFVFTFAIQPRRTFSDVIMDLGMSSWVQLSFVVWAWSFSGYLLRVSVFFLKFDLIDLLSSQLFAY